MTEPFLPLETLPTPTTVGYDRPGGDHRQSRSVVLGRRGAIATSHPLASAAGLQLLRQGGTAVDAAIAANAMLGVVEPMSCGIGGDLFALIWEQRTQTLHGLNASGRSPALLNHREFTDRGLDSIPVHGPLSWSVPGCVDGWRLLLKRFGRCSWGQLLQEAIETAERGFAVSEIIAASWKSAESELAAWPSSRQHFLLNGRAPAYGAVMHNRPLADVYRRLAEHGPDDFYRGQLAQQLADFCRSQGSVLGEQDLAEHRSNWVEPVSVNYRGHTVWQLPPNGQGLATLQMLNLLEPYPIGELEHNGVEHLHLLIEAKKLAFEDRARYYADPEFADVPVAELVSTEYAARRARLINPEAASRQCAAGDPRLEHGDTVYITAVDGEGNCCSLIQSIFHGFGSMVAAGDLGYLLQNRGCLFSLDPRHANVFEPGKRPFHTIIPGFVTRDQKPFLCFGVMGGDMQPQGQTQVLMNILDFGMNVQSAGDAARVRHFGSSTPTGRPADPDGGRVAVESGLDPQVLRQLAARGHQLCRAPGTFGGYQAIQIDNERGVLHAASDPRKDGAAMGY